MSVYEVQFTQMSDATHEEISYVFDTAQATLTAKRTANSPARTATGCPPAARSNGRAVRAAHPAMVTRRAARGAATVTVT